ncbi:hypothetical protein CC2G_012657 [Coprinopsis cinerea AmutBmut pab1-1]|nr:hypothetical protein CC2G_012657 [Coprinopsis cinerea AmutBmut pab1-1]
MMPVNFNCCNSCSGCNSGCQSCACTSCACKNSNSMPVSYNCGNACTGCNASCQCSSDQAAFINTTHLVQLPVNRIVLAM